MIIKYFTYNNSFKIVFEVTPICINFFLNDAICLCKIFFSHIKKKNNDFVKNGKEMQFKSLSSNLNLKIFIGYLNELLHFFALYCTISGKQCITIYSTKHGYFLYQWLFYELFLSF